MLIFTTPLDPTKKNASTRFCSVLLLGVTERARLSTESSQVRHLIFMNYRSDFHLYFNLVSAGRIFSSGGFVFGTSFP